MPKELKCLVCGKTFITDARNRKYCSIDCRKEATRELKQRCKYEVKECAICGKKFIGAGECCSVTCRILNSGMNPYAPKEIIDQTPAVQKIEVEARKRGLSYGYYVAQSRIANL